jgi:ORF6N domain
LIAAPTIEKRILVVRERQVMLDEDLADLYGVETKRLVEQVKRNRDRFPEDFMFRLSKEEAAALRSQIATSNDGRGGRRYA